MTTKVTSSVLANTAVTAGTYGGTTQIGVVTVDQQGRITYAANVTPSIANTQITGLITNTQISSVDASKITGSITSGQIATVSSTQITGTITGAQLAAGAANTNLGFTPLAGITGTQVTTALGYTPYNSTNPAGYTTNLGTVTSVSGTGTVSGLTLTGSVTTSGSLTLGGTLTLTSGQVTTALGFTPYNSTNPSGFGSGTVTSVATGNGLQGGTITTSGTLSIAAPGFNTVGSYVYGVLSVGGSFNIPSGSTYSAGNGNFQVRSFVSPTSGGVNNLSGTWAYMSGSYSNSTPCSENVIGLFVRVS